MLITSVPSWSPAPARARAASASSSPAAQPQGQEPAWWNDDPTPKLTDPPTPVGKLPRPVLCIAGGRSRDKGLPEVIHYLTADGNNSFGGSFGADRKEWFADRYARDGGNVFTLRYSKKFASFSHNAGEIKQAVDEIRRLTGADEIDIVAECKGAMELREYLRQGHDGVRNAVMIVPPNHGLVIGGDIAWVVGKAVDKLHLPIKSFSGYPLDADGLEAISSFSTNWQLGPLKGNKHLARFNAPENVANESRVLNSLTVVSGEGKNLLEGSLGPGLPFPIMRGDHSIPNWSAFLPHANNFFYDGDRAHHGQVKSHPEALAKIAETLTMDGQPVKDEAYSATQPTPARALTRAAAWTGSFAGRMNAAWHATAGTSAGNLGRALGGLGAGLAFLDGTRQLIDVVQGDAPQGRARAGVGALGKYAQGVGTVMSLAGVGGWTAAALIGGGLVASMVTA